jgi:homogentisate 1,2-dioxygenase
MTEPSRNPSAQALAAGYMSGFGNMFESEALPGALPVGRNSPQRCAYGLYAEQVSGTSFTSPRATNRRSWLYRIRPTLAHWGAFERIDTPLWCTAPVSEADTPLAPLRWDPLPLPTENVSFIEGIRTVTAAGQARLQMGMAAHIYVATRSMQDEYFSNAEGEMLVVPEQGGLRFRTEFGVVEVVPGEIAVIPRGVKMRVELTDGAARGYLCENYGAPFTLPERGLIGANSLAAARDFLTPVAAFEDRDAPSQLFVKWGGTLWRAGIAHSPLDVVAWHGNYAPCKYDLARFAPLGPVSFDHADPSIFTVLTSPSDTPGTANVDFVIFPERWLVSEDTFRPPWYHVNIMSEFMGLVRGVYEAKPHGFVPGGFSLHNSMLPHGPDAEAFAEASAATLAPVRLTDTLGIMFECRYPQQVTGYAARLPQRQRDYGLYGKTLPKNFPGPR